MDVCVFKLGDPQPLAFEWYWSICPFFQGVKQGGRLRHIDHFYFLRHAAGHPDL